jgi:hypothetical protein
VSLVPRRRPVLLAVAAAAAVALAVAAGVFATDDPPSRVATDDTPATTAPPNSGPDPAGTPSTIPSTTPSTGSTTPSTSDTTARPPGGDRPTGPIVGREGVLGTWSGSAWVQWEAGATPPDGDEYRVVRLADPVTTVVGSATIMPCGAADGVPSVEVGIEPSSGLLTPTPIAVAGVPDPRPRPVEVLDPAAPTYQEAAAAVVADLGIDDPAPQVSQVVRSDLDGDGTTEVVIAAHRLTDPGSLYGEPGDYAVTFLRRVVGGEIQTTVLASSVVEPRPEYGPFVSAYPVSGFADLNGDGRMEIVLNGRYYEGASTVVHELRPDGSAPKVLEAGCGV